VLLFKIKAYIIGFLLSLLPDKLFIKIVNGTQNTKIGLDIVNDDYPIIKKFNTQIVRINNSDFKSNRADYIEYFTLNKIEYYIQIGRSEDSLASIANEIIDSDIALKNMKKPLFYSIINEDNEFTWYSVESIESFIRIHYGKPIAITKGSYTSIVESAALKKYKDHLKNYGIPKDRFHLIHFYLKPIKENKLENCLRKLMLRYLIYSLARFGLPADKIIVSESHDASKSGKVILNKEELRPLIKKEDGSLDGDQIIKDNKDGTYTAIRYEGDYIFASKEGWNELKELFKSLGIYAGLYYHQPFLMYKGNTVLDGE
jgi:hypothetical protein